MSGNSKIVQDQSHETGEITAEEERGEKEVVGGGRRGVGLLLRLPRPVSLLPQSDSSSG